MDDRQPHLLKDLLHLLPDAHHVLGVVQGAAVVGLDVDVRAVRCVGLGGVGVHDENLWLRRVAQGDIHLCGGQRRRIHRHVRRIIDVHPIRLGVSHTCGGHQRAGDDIVRRGGDFGEVGRVLRVLSLGSGGGFRRFFLPVILRPVAACLSGQPLGYRLLIAPQQGGLAHHQLPPSVQSVKGAACPLHFSQLRPENGGDKAAVLAQGLEGLGRSPGTRRCQQRPQRRRHHQQRCAAPEYPVPLNPAVPVPFHLYPIPS